MSKQNQLMKSVQYFFQSYLLMERGLSPHTIKSYRDTLKLLLSHLTKVRRKKIYSISLDDLTADNVRGFLNAIEKERENSISTRNHRLAVIKTFASFLLTQDISRASQYEKISHIRSKAEPYEPIVYLTDEEMQALLDSVDQSRTQGIRDYAILLALYNTGARVSELCDLKPKDITFEKPHIITLTGKGQKTRHVPLWQGTVKAIRKYLEVSPKDQASRLFVGKRNEPLSRHAVLYLVQVYAKKAAKTCKTLLEKEIGPHTIRHTTAMHLLDSGVDISVIKEWLGHADLNTTHEYVEINMRMKEQALKKTTTPKTKDTISSILKQEKDIIKWLEGL